MAIPQGMVRWMLVTICFILKFFKGRGARQSNNMGTVATLFGMLGSEGNKSDGGKVAKNGGKSGRIKNSGSTEVGPLGVKCISDAIIRG